MHPGDTVGSGRFQIRRYIGEGAMGVVYEAYDRERGEAVALKTLAHLSPTAIYRLKNEYRALSDVVHPNLVTLHELFADGDTWFFTMDLVDGVSFVQHVRDDPAIGFDDTMEAAEPSGALETIRAPGGARASPSAGALRERSLRESLVQLVVGVDAIHRAGKLHRDLKPSNVLVRRDGRVVILDFGLVTDRTQKGIGQTLDGEIAGTPAYMAPEQTKSGIVTAASDWYGVGAMLYEALTGVTPFTGQGLAVLARRLGEEPVPPPSRRVAAIPQDLDELCSDLLHVDPERRPDGPGILARLGATAQSIQVQTRALSDRTASSIDELPLPFVGREREFSMLQDALSATDRGEPVLMHVRGLSGMGKSTLIDRFLNALAAADTHVVLRGRCYERESVPFKALDSVVDALSRHLLQIEDVAAARLVPQNVQALLRVFPVLRRVEALATAQQRRRLPEDAVEIRRRATVALRELLARIADRQALVVVIDDLQWADLDM